MKRMAWLVLLAAMSVGRAGLAEEPTRVVLCKSGAGVCKTVARALGQVGGDAWVEVAQDTLLSARPMPTVLYFSSRQYEEAVAGLGDKDRADAVRRRRDVVVANPFGSVQRALRSDLVRVDAGADGKGLSTVIEASAILDVGDTRMRADAPEALLEVCREDLAQLQAELPEGPLANAFAAEASELARLVTHARGAAHPPQPPFAETTAAYFVPSVSDKAFRVLQGLGGYPHRWRGGVVVLAGKHELDQPPFRGQSLKMLYPSRADYLGDLTELVQSQLDLRLRTRLQRGYDREAFLAERAFAHATLIRAVTFQLEAKHAAWLDAWKSVAAASVEGLSRVLAATKRGVGGPARATLQADLALAEAMLRDGAIPARHKGSVARASAALASLPP